MKVKYVVLSKEEIWTNNCGETLKNIDTGEWKGYHSFIVDRKEFEAMKKLFEEEVK